jgi:endogenous inhibitor of DNA gyrase (YacG/DUF329 family)
MTTQQKCPVCHKPTDPDHKPFCSKRCAKVDLGRWLTETYSVPAKPDVEEEDGD